jgi:acyl carrier protein
VPGDRRLVAYVVGDADAVDVDALREHLRRTLPAHMVPGAFVRLDALPLTPSGKVDRKALPAPESDAFSTRDYVAPVGETEEALAEIWAEVLGVEPVGIHDDFFALGGHSLLATRVVSRVRQSLGVELPLRHLFESPTIAELCRHLDDGGTADAAPPIVRADRSAPLPPSFAQERLWFVDRLIPGSSAYNMPVVLPVHGA